MLTRHLIGSVFFLIVFSACQKEPDATTPISTTSPPTPVPNALSALPDSVPFPLDNPTTEAKIELGRLLFWDPILSGEKDVACATCHHPNFAYTDGLDLSVGVGGEGLGQKREGNVFAHRNSATILNVGFNGLHKIEYYDPIDAPMLWDASAENLEKQALLPLLSAEEMRGTSIAEEAILDTILQRLNSVSSYVNLFQTAFDEDSIRTEHVEKAIAAFERSLLANNSRFDQYKRGDLTAMSSAEIAGMERFIRVGCADCHRGPMFSDYQLHILAIPDHEKVEDKGAEETYRFRTPSLRNVSLTSPYFHNGTANDLFEVLNFYVNAKDGNAEVLHPLAALQLDGEIRDLKIEEADISKIIPFLRALTDENYDRSIPLSVPSGLKVGGEID